MALVARDAMTTNIVTVSPSTSLVDLERLLISRHIGGAPVKEHGKLIGMVSRSDIIRVLTYEQSVAEVQSGAYRNELGVTDRRALELISGHVGERMQTLRVRDAMTAVRVHVAADTPLRRIAELMVKQRVHRVLVMDNDRLVGIIARSDLVRLVAEGRIRDATDPPTPAVVNAE